jgi:hypothetical protein
MARENRSPSHNPQGSHNNVSQSAIQYGDDRDHRRGQASQHSNYPIGDVGPTRQAITMGPPVTLGAGLQRNNVVLAGATATETDALRSPPGRNQRMGLPCREDHVPVRSRVAAIEQGHGQGACSTHAQGACSTCWFQATGACVQKGRTSGKGSGGRTNDPQTYQTSGAHTGKSAARDVAPLMSTATAGYATPPTAQCRRRKVASSRASDSSGASQSLDGRKQQRESEERRLALATVAHAVALAKQEHAVALAKQEIADARFRLSEMDARVSRRGTTRIIGWIIQSVRDIQFT